MSEPTGYTSGVCGECTKTWSLTKAGVLYKHPPRAETPCQGSGQEPLSAVPYQAAAMIDDAMKEFTPSEILVRDGFTNEQLEKMLSDITPKRQKLREAVRARVAGFINNVRNYFNGAWDVFDDDDANE